jgi:peptide/nickel transport system substrate-binding protein
VGPAASWERSAAATTLAAGLPPNLARSEQARKLVFVPTSDLTVLDPVVTFNRPTRNYAYLVFDTLYGIDTNWMAQPQMVEGPLRLG